MVYSAQASVLHPMSLMFVNNSMIDNNVEILCKVKDELGIDGSCQQCIAGDQATCVTIRGARRRRVAEPELTEKLQWARENPGDFHFMWECLKVIFLLFWGSPKDEGSLSHFKAALGRESVNQSAKKFQQCDEFLHHVMEGYVTASLLGHLGIASCDVSIPGAAGGQPTMYDLQQLSQSFVKEIVDIPRDEDSETADHLFNRHRSFINASLLYTNLRNAVRREDGPRIISLWNWWLVYFVATKRSNYSHEAANLKADFSPWLSHIVTMNRTVNITGVPGKGKAIDMAVEHHNLIIKDALRTSGANISANHLQTISLASQMLHETAAITDSQVLASVNTSNHKESVSRQEIEKIVELLMVGKVTSKVPNRQLSTGKQFRSPYSKGCEEALGKRWIQNFLAKTGSVFDEEYLESEAHEEIEVMEDVIY